MYPFNLHTFCINVYTYLFCFAQDSSQINVHNWNSIPAMYIYIFIYIYIKYHLNERLKKNVILRLRSPTLARYWRHLMMYKLEMPATVSLIQVLKLEQSCGTTVAENLGSYWRTEITANSDARRINVLEGKHHEFSHHSPVTYIWMWMEQVLPCWTSLCKSQVHLLFHY